MSQRASCSARAHPPRSNPAASAIRTAATAPTEIARPATSSAGSPATASVQSSTPLIRPSSATSRCSPLRSLCTSVPGAVALSAPGTCSLGSRPDANSPRAATDSAAAVARRSSPGMLRGASGGTPSASADATGTSASRTSSRASSASPAAVTARSSAETPPSRVSRVKARPRAHSPLATLTGTGTPIRSPISSRSATSRRSRSEPPRSSAQRATWSVPTHQEAWSPPSPTGRTSAAVAPGTVSWASRATSAASGQRSSVMIAIMPQGAAGGGTTGRRS